MELTLWRQFSSNHSNSFSLVGVFASEEQALKAYERISKLLDDVEVWREENDEDDYETVSPYEYAIAKRYGFYWDGEPTEQVSVKRYKHIVEVDADADSWTRRKPYQLLLQKLGGDVAGWDGAEQSDDLSAPTVFRAHITATAESEAKADELLQALQTKLNKVITKHYGVHKKATVSKDGQKLSIANLPLTYIEVFGSFVDFLTESGCSDIQYQMTKESIGNGGIED